MSCNPAGALAALALAFAIENNELVLVNRPQSLIEPRVVRSNRVGQVGLALVRCPTLLLVFAQTPTPTTPRSGLREETSKEVEPRSIKEVLEIRYKRICLAFDSQGDLVFFTWTPIMKISCQSAMSGELLLDLELEPSNSLSLGFPWYIPAEGGFVVSSS